jgi:hypothetical protein
MVQNHSLDCCKRGNALNSRRKFSQHASKHRPLDPSEIRRLVFKRKIPRFAICSVSGTIGIDRSIFLKLIENVINARQWKNTVTVAIISADGQPAGALTIGTP